jgi:hypothetical protein
MSGLLVPFACIRKEKKVSMTLHNSKTKCMNPLVTKFPAPFE